MSFKAIFLDRDDTIIEDPGYINTPEQVKLINGAAGAIADFRKMGYKLIVVSNQSGIARGIITESVLGQIHERLKQLLAEQNAYLDRIYYCPYHVDGVIPRFRKDSDDRKPKPGMLLTAAKEMKIDMAESWMIGNTYHDVAAGKAAGCRTILIKSHLKMPVKGPDDPQPNFEAVNLREAVNIVKREIAPKPAPVPVEPKIEEEKPMPVEPKPQLRIVRQEPEPEPEEIVDTPQEQEVNNAETPAVETAAAAEQNIPKAEPIQPGSNTERLLEDIRLLLKSRNRDELYGKNDFSMFKLFAGLLQMIVLACLFIAMRYKMSPNNEEVSVFTALGFAIVFQLMALTVYIMHNEK